jgi:energy-coupling factor transporter transmembrane protein EcfT
LWANREQSWLHRSSVLAKLLLVSSVLLTVVLAQHAVLLLAAYACLLALLLSTSLPALPIISASLYTVIFVALFAVSRWDGTWLTFLTIVLKAPTIALAVLLLVTTTPYPRLFAVLNRLLPRLLAESLLVSYRAVFILLELARQLVHSLRLRGGFARRSLWQRIQNLSVGLGLVFIHSLDYLQQLYTVLRLRGYTGAAADQAGWEGFHRADLPLLVLATGLAASALLGRATSAKWPMYAMLIAGAAVALGTGIWRVWIRAQRPPQSS